MKLLRKLAPARATIPVAIIGSTLAVGGSLVMVAQGRSDYSAVMPSGVTSIREHFQLLRSPAGAPAPPAMQAAVRRAPAFYGLDVSAARQAADGTWLIPGVGGLCMALNDSEGVGMSCTTTPAAESGELRFSVRDQATGEEHIVGAAPDNTAKVTGLDHAGNRVAASPVRESTYVMDAREVVKMQDG